MQMTNDMKSAAMNLTTDTRRKQTAIYHCLKELLTPQQLMEAMLLWQDKHAQRQGLAVRYFADDVAALTGGRHSSKVLTLKMVSAIAGARIDQADPSEHIAAYRVQVGRYVASQKSSQVTAFNLLINKLLLLAGDETAATVKKQVRAQVGAGTQFSSTLQTALVKALRAEPFELALGDVAVAHLKMAINLFYVALCDTVGPVHADRLFAQSLARLESNGGAQYTDIFKALM